MEDVIVRTEDLSKVDCDGGFRRTITEVTIDCTQSWEKQERALIYELLSAMLDAIVSHEKILNITQTLGDALDQLMSGGEKC